MVNKPSGETNELAIYADGSLELVVSLAQCIVLNNSAIELSGKSLIDLANEEPAHTYTLIKKMVGSLAAKATYVSVNEKVITDRDSDGQDATSHIASNVFTDRMPEPYEGPVKFSLGVHVNEDDEALVGNSLGNRLSVLEIDVEPPSYY